MPRPQQSNVGHWFIGYTIAVPVCWVARAVIRIGSGFNLYGSEGPQPQQEGRWPHDKWEQLAMEDADRMKQGLPTRPSVDDDCPRLAAWEEGLPVDPDEGHSTQGEQFDNFRKFITVTMQAVRRCVNQAADGGNTPLRVQDLPGKFEEQWGTIFEKSRLGLQDLSDLVDLLEIFPSSFIVDKTNPDAPTVACQPPDNSVRLLDDAMVQMLWQRSQDLQPKKLLECLDTYRDSKEEAWTTAIDICRQRAGQTKAARRQKTKRKAQRRAAKGHSGEARAGSRVKQNVG